MRFHRAGTALEHCALVFLDNADWSYLEQGAASASAAELRQLCAAGEAKILVTRDHLLEVAPLKRGLRARLEFVQDFPGTIWVPLSGADLCKTAATELALHALGRDMAPWKVECSDVRAVPIAQLEKFARGLRPLWWAEDLAARIGRIGRAPEAATKQQRDMGAKLHRLAREGRTDDAWELVARIGEGKRVPRWIQHAAVRGLVALYDWGNSKGIVSAASKGDFIFDKLVTSALPPSVASNTRVMAVIYRAWMARSRLLAVAPSLACVAEIERHSSRTKDVQKVRSTEFDKRHAAFAPLVEIFTCDGRNAPLLTKALRGAEPQPRIVRTARLADVVTAIRQCRATENGGAKSASAGA